MFNQPLDVFIPIIALLANIAGQVLLFRFFFRSKLLISIFIAFFLGFFIFFCFDFFNKRSFSVFLVHLLTYGSFSYCYFHFINLGETARRIRILRELRDSSNGLSLSEILKNYNANEIIDCRLSRLIKSQQVIFKNNRYYIGRPMMYLIARILVALKYLLLGKGSEFD